MMEKCARTSGRVSPHASHILSMRVRWSNTCSTRFQRSVMTYWFPRWSAVKDAAVATAATVVVLAVDGAFFKPWSRSNASTNWAHVVSLAMPEIQRCSPCTQIGISSIAPADAVAGSSTSSQDDETGDCESNECLSIAVPMAAVWTPWPVSLLSAWYADETWAGWREGCAMMPLGCSLE